ncbi:MAG: putative sensor domain DACNV-containing protein [Candidatus Korobacteraceae bacterium]
MNDSMPRIMREPAYPAARTVAARVEQHFRRHASSNGGAEDAPAPSLDDIELLVDVAFWASLRREEGFSPKISMAYLPAEPGNGAMVFRNRLALTPSILAKLAPAVERPGIHLGIWRQDGDLALWGSTRTLPPFCFVLEVVGPGVLVIKHRRREESGKFTNVVVLEGDTVKFVNEQRPRLGDCQSMSTALLGFFNHEPAPASIDYMVELATSMRAHGRGGTLLVVPDGKDTWLDSMLQPIAYAVSPPYSGLRELVRGGAANGLEDRRWLISVRRAVDGIAGLTAVDGATVVSSEYDLLAFGAKISRRTGCERVEQVIVTEPIEGASASVAHPSQLGGTRHLSAAQFAHDQHDAVALVASQDGRFTIFTWSECDQAVLAHRAESLLL